MKQKTITIIITEIMFMLGSSIAYFISGEFAPSLISFMGISTGYLSRVWQER